MVIGLLVALLLAGVVSYYASTSPDGLNRVAEDKGFSQTRTEHHGDGSPLAGYGTKGVGDERVSRASPAWSARWSCWCWPAGVTLLVRRRARSRVGDEREPPSTAGADVGAGHGHKLHFHGHSPVHRAPAHLKVLALLGFMLLVVATPGDWYSAFAGYLAVLGRPSSRSAGCRRRTSSSGWSSRCRSWSSRC